MLTAGASEGQVLDRCYSPEPGRVQVDMTAMGQISIAADGMLILLTEVGVDHCDAIADSVDTVSVRAIPNHGPFDSFTIDHGGAGGPFSNVAFDLELGGGKDLLRIEGTSGNDSIAAVSRSTHDGGVPSIGLVMKVHDRETGGRATSVATTSSDSTFLQVVMFGGRDSFANRSRLDGAFLGGKGKGRADRWAR